MGLFPPLCKGVSTCLCKYTYPTPTSDTRSKLTPGACEGRRRGETEGSDQKVSRLAGTGGMQPVYLLGYTGSLSFHSQSIPHREPSRPPQAWERTASKSSSAITKQFSGSIKISPVRSLSPCAQCSSLWATGSQKSKPSSPKGCSIFQHSSVGVFFGFQTPRVKS